MLNYQRVPIDPLTPRLLVHACLLISRGVVIISSAGRVGEVDGFPGPGHSGETGESHGEIARKWGGSTSEQNPLVK